MTLLYSGAFACSRSGTHQFLKKKRMFSRTQIIIIIIEAEDKNEFLPRRSIVISSNCHVSNPKPSHISQSASRAAVSAEGTRV